VPLSSGGSLTLARRDLFDARFQLISESEEEGNPGHESAPPSALDFVEAPSDLVRGVYEGGLKTWECSVDLVDYLNSVSVSRDVQGKRVLEVRALLFVSDCPGVNLHQ
jgi:protein-histidine N-methyltransferase